MITINISDLTNEDKNTLRNIAELIKTIAENSSNSLQQKEQKSHNVNFTPAEIEESKNENWSVTPECTNLEEAKTIAWEQNHGADQTEELDSEGKPWNAELHSRTKSKNKDGTWRVKRGLQEETVEEISKEYHTQLPKPPIVEAPKPPVAPATTITFPQLMLKISQGIMSKKLTHARVNEIVESMGLTSLNELDKHPELLQLADEQFKGVIHDA